MTVDRQHASNVGTNLSKPSFWELAGTRPVTATSSTDLEFGSIQVEFRPCLVSVSGPSLLDIAPYFCKYRNIL